MAAVKGEDGPGLELEAAARADQHEARRLIDVVDDAHRQGDGSACRRLRGCLRREGRRLVRDGIRFLPSGRTATRETGEEQGHKKTEADTGDDLHGKRLGDTAGKSKIADGDFAGPEVMNVFVYGTLLVPKIWETVTKTGGLVSREATLAGHEIRCVRDAVYPAIFASPDSGGSIPGRVFFDVPETALRRLDAYEDDFYRREEVHPEIEGIGKVSAQAYLVSAADVPRLLSPQGWSLAWFEKNGLEGFWERVFQS